MSTQTITNAIADYFRTQPVVRAWLFGSFARGEETPLSDVDILVVLDPSQPVGLKFFGMWNDLEHLLDRRVDLVTEGSLADFARESVERDKILIYERAGGRLSGRSGLGRVGEERGGHQGDRHPQGSHADRQQDEEQGLRSEGNYVDYRSDGGGN